jgi:hypothetical protein
MTVTAQKTYTAGMIIAADPSRAAMYAIGQFHSAGAGFHAYAPCGPAAVL